MRVASGNACTLSANMRETAPRSKFSVAEGEQAIAREFIELFHPLHPEPVPTEVVAKAKRRRFTAEYKRKILREVDACTEPGAIGALLRREGLYSSHLVEWRKLRDRGELAGLEPKKRGPKARAQPAREAARRKGPRERPAQGRERQAASHLRGPKKSLGDLGHLAAPDPGRRRAGQQPDAVVNAAHGTSRARRRDGVHARCDGAQLLPPVRVAEAYATSARRRRVRCRATSDSSARRAARAALRRPRAGRGVRDAARRGALPLLGAHDVPRSSPRTGEVRERRDQLRHPNYAAPELLATAPNQLWSWDITKLLGPAKWTYFYLYVILDVFSRYVVGWMVAHRETRRARRRS